MLLGFAIGVLRRLGQALRLLPGTHLYASQDVAKCHRIKHRLPQRHVGGYVISIDPPHAVLGEISIGYKLRNDAVDKPFGQPQPVRHLPNGEMTVLRNQGKHCAVTGYEFTRRHCAPRLTVDMH
jgi:hypothetical protein